MFSIWHSQNFDSSSLAVKSAIIPRICLSSSWAQPFCVCTWHSFLFLSRKQLHHCGGIIASLQVRWIGTASFKRSYAILVLDPVIAVKDDRCSGVYKLVNVSNVTCRSKWDTNLWALLSATSWLTSELRAFGTTILSRGFRCWYSAHRGEHAMFSSVSNYVHHQM